MGLSTTYTKTETDFLLQQLEKKTASGYKGDLRISDPAPTEIGFYGLLETGVYPNLGNIDAQAGKLNFASFDGATWSKVEVTMPSIANGSVTPEKTTFAQEAIQYGKNRFNKNTVTTGFYVNAFTGALNANSNYVASDWIFVGDLQGQNIMFSPLLIHVAFYTEKNDASFISGREYGGDTIQVPQNANWMRHSVYSYGDYLANYQVESGSVATAYEAFQTPTNAILIPNLVLPQTPTIEKLFPKILLPSIYWLAQGIEYNFYFSSFFVAPFAEDLNNYYKSVFSYRGKFLEKKLNVTANDDFTMTYKIEDSEDRFAKKTINVLTAPTANGTGVNRKVLVIGDSTINSGTIVKRISDYFATDVMDVTLLGTRQTLGVNHEGRSGWTLQNYIESASISGVANPFYNNGTFDFANYLSTTSQTMTNGDWVFIQLGINDLYGIALQDGSQTPTAIETRLNEVKARLQLVINSIKAYNSNIRVGIIQTFPPAISQDATGNLLNSSFYSLEQYYKKGIAEWWDILLAEYDTEAKRTAEIYLIGANAVIDRENDFATAMQNVDQYDTTQIEVQMDDVHPYDGYNQVGDIYIGAIKYFG